MVRVSDRSPSKVEPYEFSIGVKLRPKLQENEFGELEGYDDPDDLEAF